MKVHKIIKQETDSINTDDDSYGKSPKHMTTGNLSTFTGEVKELNR
jgi:hypothetical protein